MSGPCSTGTSWAGRTFPRGNVQLNPRQAVVNRALVKMARERPVFPSSRPTTPITFPGKTTNGTISCSVSRHDSLEDENRMSFSSTIFRSPEEMEALFGAELPDTLDNTVAIAERCNVRLPSATGTTSSPTCGFPRRDARATLRKTPGRTERAARRRCFYDQYAQRQYELGVINSMGFAGYFLIVAGIIKNKRGIPIGPGRGSAAGSVVAWSLRITELDPIRYNLLFERFLNPERIEYARYRHGRIIDKDGMTFFTISPSITAPTGYPDRYLRKDEKPGRRHRRGSRSRHACPGCDRHNRQIPFGVNSIADANQTVPRTGRTEKSLK